MTDLEITRLCAEAMGYTFVEEYGWPAGTITYLGDFGEKHYYWRPLHDDAQAMALVKKFDLYIHPGTLNRETVWHVERIEVLESGAVDDRCCAYAPSLNRAICECVAKMQSATISNGGSK